MLKWRGVTFVPTVTREHARKFAQRWFMRSVGVLDILEAVDITEIMKHDDNEAAEVRYCDLVDEILERTLHGAMGAVEDAFMTAAQQVIDRASKKG